jgi:hypothetical protein
MQKIKAEEALVILVAPWWTRAPWFPTVVSLLIEFQIRLLFQRDLLMKRLPSQGLARRADTERESLRAEGLSEKAMAISHRATRSSSRAIYDATWAAFIEWYTAKTWIPSQCLFPGHSIF